jgi:NADH-quinone oxidoreductase subunit L
VAANKAFIVNRIGDFGFLVGLMALWSSLGTLHFADNTSDQGLQQGLFSQLRSESNDYALAIPPAVENEALRGIAELTADNESQAGYWLLCVAGIGIFCGCIGKSAQFPLHVWLPDAMEGPTPVSALVHSATMVAAGVYLVGRTYPLFTPEVLLVIAIVGCVTLALAATMAITAVDIKRVLAYSTVSQLGYMMLSLGLGGWVAGLFHLITHAFFKGLLFMCSGSVIHAVHTNDMRLMGGLRHKMPITAYTMLVGCLAIIGAGIPATAIGLSGYYSKDAMLEQAWSFAGANPQWRFQLLLFVPLLGASVTAFYMFRLWFMTFAGSPRDHHRYDHAQESPRSMTTPLVVLAVFAIAVGWHVPFSELSVTSLLEQATPVGTQATVSGVLMPGLTLPDEHLSHVPEIRYPAGLAAFLAATLGVLLAATIYVWRWLDAEELRQAFRPAFSLLWHKWWFDELYDWAFVRPTKWIAAVAAGIDRMVIDRLIHVVAGCGRGLAAVVDRVFDKSLVDGSIDVAAQRFWDFGKSLHNLQTGRLRSYVVFVVVGTLATFAIVSVLWKYAIAG